MSAGWFTLPDGGIGYQGRMAAGHVAVSGGLDRLEVVAAGGAHRIRGGPNSRHLRHGNGRRDYELWTGSLQLRADPGIPVSVAVEGMHNARGYSADDPDPFTAAHRDDRSGYALHAGLGRPGVGGNGSLGYSYAVIGALSVHSSYAQDDWVRWGTQVQTDSSDLKGHEIRAAWAFSSRSNVTARLFLVGGLSSSRETRRFRIDFNRSF